VHPENETGQEDVKHLLNGAVEPRKKIFAETSAALQRERRMG
jgi:hypothetical protein